MIQKLWAAALFLLPKTLLALKVLILIIASDNEPRYIELQKLWRSYMHSDPEHVECYFIRGDDKLLISNFYRLEGDVLWSKTKESTVPGILMKTLYSFEYFQPRFNEFDFIIRTNLSSFYIFPRLLDYLETLPKKGCYSGPLARFDITAASGCGIIFSPDVVELIIEHRSLLMARRRVNYDDVIIWELLSLYKTHIIPSPLALVNNQEALGLFLLNPPPPLEAFHLRVAYPDIYAELVKMFYPGALK